MALADRITTLASMESIEARRLLAFVANGAAGVLVGSDVIAVDSAAARPDTTNHNRYASVLTDPHDGGSVQGGDGTVVQVTGADSSTGAASSTAIPAESVSTVLDTDVAANNPSANTYVVVFQNRPIGGADLADDVDAQLYSNGSPVGRLIRVNTSNGGAGSRVAMAADGSFVVVWEQSINDASDTTSSGTQVFARRYDATGAPLTGPVQISGLGGTGAVGTGNGVEPDVAVNANGQYVISWVDGTGTRVEAFNARGGAASDILTVADQTLTNPAVGIFTNGGFVVAYGGAGAGNNTAIFAQRYNASGNAVGALTTISTTPAAAAVVPEVSVATNNSYAIGWAQSTAAAPSTFDTIAFNAYTLTGTVIGPETTITNVAFGDDRRFGLSYRLATDLYVDYATAPDAMGVGGGQALEQAYTNSAATGGGGGGSTSGDELPVPTGALLIDRTTSTVGEVIDVHQTGSNYVVTVDGVTTNYPRFTTTTTTTNGHTTTTTTANYTSIYLRGGTGSDAITFHSDVTLPATIYGRAGSDIIYGGSGADLIDGEDGWDQIQGYDGNDTVLGGGGRNTLFGGAGTDSIVGGGGSNDDLGFGNPNRIPNSTRARNADTTDRRNTIYGEADADLLTGSGADDVIYGGAGNDTIFGGDGADRLDGGTGNDTVEGEAGNDFLYGGRGNDFMEAGDGDDFLSGGRDTDSLYGNDGSDTLYGDSGVDRLFGGPQGRSVLGSTPGDIGYVDGLDTVVNRIETVIDVR